jgi:Icc-related predicted phosphoesterase
MNPITIVGIADTHGAHSKVKVPDGDILVVAGDFCGHGSIEDVIAFNAWLGTLPHKYKVIVAGNHDWVCQRSPGLMKEMFSSGIYLENESVELYGIKIYGSPWTPEFYNWAFMYERDSQRARDLWANIPDDTDVLVTHGPPSGVDLSWVDDIYHPMSAVDAGCRVLRKRIQDLPRLKASFHGHIHGGHGVGKIYQVTCMNVSVMNETYDVVNPGRIYKYEQ